MMTLQEIERLGKDMVDLQRRTTSLEQRAEVTDSRLKMIADDVLEHHESIKKLVTNTAEAMRTATATMEVLLKALSKPPPALDLLLADSPEDGSAA